MAHLGIRRSARLGERTTATGGEARLLRLDSSKAASLLGWRPRLSFDDTMAFTGDWYAAELAGNADMAAFTNRQLATYRALLAPAPSEELQECA
jgi:CDP-glucose 4,6-dehydratase